MNHPTEWLEAYYDGELDAERSARLEAHLQTCSFCQNQLDELENLSVLLQAAPSPVFTHSAQAFAAQVESQLPTRPQAPGWKSAGEFGWRLAPVALLAAWSFFQALSFLITISRNSGLAEALGLNHLGEVFFQSLPELGVLFSFGTAFHLFPGVGQLASWLTSWIGNLALTLTVGGGLWAWSASWWIYQNRRLPAVNPVHRYAQHFLD
jgi:anti-sigma factor RsiW